VKKGNGRRPAPFMVARWCGREERQGGPGVGAAWSEGSVEQRGGPCVVGDSSGGGIGPWPSGVSGDAAA
jgi:hypothetical protein